MSGFSGTDRAQEFRGTNTQALRQFKKSDNGRISVSVLKATDILLGKSSDLGKLLLGQALLQPYPAYVLSNQCPHVHSCQDLRIT